MKKIVTNKKAYFDYHIIEIFEAGLVLTGNEIKAIRESKISIKESFARIKNNEMFLINGYIGRFSQNTNQTYDEYRTRKLLLHKKEILKIIQLQKLENLTIVPLDVHFNKKYAKINIALVRGKKKHDKREDLKRKDIKREIEKTIKYQG